jgi:putative ABC transport system ATP-binding protein
VTGALGRDPVSTPSPHAGRKHEENTTAAGSPCDGRPVQRGVFERTSPRYDTHHWWNIVAILKVNTLSKVYGEGDTQITALDSVSFGVEQGEFVAIVGPSGSGKSTLLHILGGVDTPSSGQVLVDGTDICALGQTKLAMFRRRQIGLIYQFYNLIPILDVEDNISLPLLLDGRNLDGARLTEIVATLGLTDRVRHLPNQLSGGQQQRVSIGRALINNPALVLADEPTGNLDSANSKEIISLLKLSNRRYHQTLIVVTHDRDIALQADRVISFGDGRIVRDEAVRA